MNTHGQTDAVIVDRLWKQSLGQTPGFIDNKWFQETMPGSLDVNRTDIYASDIPFNNPSQAISNGVAEYVELFLTKDNSYDGRVWVIRTPWTNNYASGPPSGDGGASVTKNFISTKYGSLFIGRVFRPDKITEIPPSDATVPLIDYKTGVVTFQNNMASIATGANTNTTGSSGSLYFKGYRYTGIIGFTSTGGGGGTGATLSFLGPWTNNIPYTTNSLVQYNGSTYYSAITNNLNNQPDTSTNWLLFVSKGDISGFQWTGQSNDWIRITTNTGIISAQFTSNFFIYAGTGGTNTGGGGGTGEGINWRPIGVSVSSFDATANDFILANTQSGNILINLPDSGSNSGKVIAARKQVNDNLLQIKSTIGNSVQGVNTITVLRAGTVVELISDGATNWWLK